MVLVRRRFYSLWGECTHFWRLLHVDNIIPFSLNSSSFAWACQVPHFGRKEEYTALVFDNRGVGYSGVPAGPFKTSSMAQDVVALLDYVGWTTDRSVHVVGISLGGMIAQGTFDPI